MLEYNCHICNLPIYAFDWKDSVTCLRCKAFCLSEEAVTTIEEHMEEEAVIQENLHVFDYVKKFLERNEAQKKET